MYKCKCCGAIFGPYTKRTFSEQGEEELWGHIQMNHEEVFKENQNLETPDMIHTCYRELNPCLRCGFYNSEYEGCELSETQNFLCPLEDEKEV